MQRMLPEADAAHLGVFRGSTSTWSSSALRHAVRTGRIHRVRPDFYVDAEGWLADDDSPAACKQRLRIASIAATLAVTGSRSSHRSAAALDGMPLWNWSDIAPCVTLPPGRDCLAVATHVHRARLPDHHLAGARTTPGRTILDLAREHGVREAVVAGDHALHVGLTTVDQLRAISMECAYFPGIRRARRVIDMLDGRSESPLESVSRLVIADLPFPQPELQYDIFDEFDRFLGRADKYWDELGMFGEVDGKEKYQAGFEVVLAEKNRHDALAGVGLVGVRWGKREVDAPRLLYSKLLDAQQRARRRHPSERRWRAVPHYPAPRP